MELVNLSDISTQAANAEYKAFSIIPLLRALDHVEYSMGLERGEIADFETRPSATIQMPNDMIPLYSEGKWALLPTMDTMASDLFSANSKCATKDRMHFTTSLPEREYTYQLLPIVTKNHELVPFYVNGVAYPFPFTNSSLLKTTLHPSFVRRHCEDYLMDGHNDACPTTGLTELDRCRIAVGTTVELKRAINMSWFQATTREISSPRSYAKTRPDPTSIPESEEEKAVRWFRDNILPSADVPFNGDIGETDMRVLKKMSAWHSAVMHPSEIGDGEITNDQARASLLAKSHPKRRRAVITSLTLTNKRKDPTLF